MAKLVFFIFALVLLLAQLLSPFLVQRVNPFLFEKIFAWSKGAVVIPRSAKLASGSSYFSLLIIWLVAAVILMPRKKDFLQYRQIKREKNIAAAADRERRLSAVRKAGYAFAAIQKARTNAYYWELSDICSSGFFRRINVFNESLGPQGIRYFFEL